MDTIKMDESKKTIVAFAAGLLIGALLVWAFTSAMPTADQDRNTNDNESGLTDNNNVDSVNGGDNTADDSDDRTSDDDSRDEADETFSIDDQDAGDTVELGDITFPDGIGWIAVSDYEDGVAGRFLGAARYDTAVGLEPTEIELLRATEAGKTYRVSFFKENGDMEFSRAGGDVEIADKAAFFEAE